jgi:hypothetical protein
MESRLVAHIGIPGPAPFIATGLFLVGVGAAYGAWWLNGHRPTHFGRIPALSLGVVSGACLVLATIAPILLGARPSLGRPSTRARLQIVSPAQGQVLYGDPASVRVALRLNGGSVVSFTSLRLVPNEGHIHLYLDNSLVSMTSGLTTNITASPGRHELRAEFVAVDHGAFAPPVVARVVFSVIRPRSS